MLVWFNQICFEKLVLIYIFNIISTFIKIVNIVKLKTLKKFLILGYTNIQSQFQWKININGACVLLDQLIVYYSGSENAFGKFVYTLFLDYARCLFIVTKLLSSANWLAFAFFIYLNLTKYSN